jgi:hypothetical protein
METIFLRKSIHNKTTSFYTNCSWFRECDYFTFTFLSDRFIIKKQRLNQSKSAKKCTQRKDCKGNVFEFIIPENVPMGTHEIDFILSNEDQLTVFYGA